MGSGEKEKDGEAVDASVLTASDERPREKRPKSRSDKDPDRERHRERTKGERRERKDRDKDRDRDRDRDKDRDRDRDRDGHRHHKSSSTRSSRHKSSSNPDGDSHLSNHSSRRRHRTKEEREADRAKKSSSMTDLVPELTNSRISMPYPSFSKAHSKESVRGPSGDGEKSTTETNDPVTPDPTDLGASRPRSKSVDGSGASANSHQSSRKSSSHKGTRPPSPPETDLSGEKRRSAYSGNLNPEYDPDTQRPKSRASGLSRSGSKRSDKSRPSSYTHRVSDERSAISDERTAGARSEATSVAPKRVSSRKSSRIPSPMDGDDSPDSVQDSSPKTPTTAPHFPPPHAYSSSKSPSNHHFRYSTQDRPTPTATPGTDFGPPPPPPPPPGSMDFSEVPRVDYLLQHGGLNYPVSKNFLSVVPRFNGTRPSNPPLAGAEVLFAPFFNLLGQYENVINKQGSVAVATGHKSVARRLLDRLEDVFSRDLPEVGCACVMCEPHPEQHRGLGWGEVLERVSGRVEMPPWPPFDLASIGQSAAEVAAEIPPRPASPVKLDPDIAEEFREHYLRQSKKVKAAVDKWMNNCDEAPAPPPTDVDDETLAFAILTNLDREDQPFFNALLTGTKELHPTLRAPTPMRKNRTDFMVKTGLALQRVYRLQQAPRDAETAMFLVKNPGHHDLLATITDMSPQEWEILISGRFDGFLWSGADAEDIDMPLSRGATPNMFSPPPSRGGAGTPSIPTRSTPGFGASRNTTPFSGIYSRGPTPASFISLSSSANSQGHSRQAVSHDEELEMAVLAEVEREIYQGMEALEDAFEKLHHRAEVVRNALRQRNTGLSMNMQNRRGIDVLPQLSGDSAHSGYQRPPWAMGEDDGGASESDWGGDDFTDLAPEDSASNVSSSRHRRPKRRTERRTPAPIEEEDEG